MTLKQDKNYFDLFSHFLESQAEKSRIYQKTAHRVRCSTNVNQSSNLDMITYRLELIYTSPLHVQQVRENIMGGKHEMKTSLSVVVDLKKARHSVPGEGRSWRRDCDVLEAELVHHVLSKQQKPCQKGERLAGGGDGRVRAPNQRAREARLCGAGPRQAGPSRRAEG